LQRRLSANVDEAHALVRSFLLQSQFQPQRAGRREIAEPDIGDVRPFG
jgi:hypothetical protein